MQNKYILENYYTHKSVGLNHLNAVYVTEFTHILASFWKILRMSPSSERGTGGSEIRTQGVHGKEIMIIFL